MNGFLCLNQMLTSQRLSDKKIYLLFAGMLGFVLCILLFDPVYYPPILFGLFVSPLILYCFLSKPSFFALVFVSFAMFRIQEIIPPLASLPIAFITGSLGVLSLTINAFYRKLDIFWCRELTYFTLFFLWITASTLLSYDFLNSYNSWNLFFKLFIGILLIVWSFQKKADFLVFFYICIISGIISSLIVIHNQSIGLNLIEGSRATINAAGGSIGDPNDLALSLLIPFGFSLAAVTFGSTSYLFKSLGLVCSLLITTGILLTQSRGGLLGLVGVFMLALYTRTKYKSLSVITGTLFAAITYLLGNISSRQADLTLDESSSDRIEAWKAAIKMALRHPLFGVGPGNFTGNFSLYSSLKHHNMVTHSSWLSVLSETGFLGLILMISCVYFTFRHIKLSIARLEASNNKADKKTLLVLAYGVYFGLAGICIAGSFLNQGYSWFFYVLFAMAISLSHYTKKLGQTHL